jgi:hypothetical protein
VEKETSSNCRTGPKWVPQTNPKAANRGHCGEEASAGYRPGPEMSNQALVTSAYEERVCALLDIIGQPRLVTTLNGCVVASMLRHKPEPHCFSSAGFLTFFARLSDGFAGRKARKRPKIGHKGLCRPWIPGENDNGMGWRCLLSWGAFVSATLGI